MWVDGEELRWIDALVGWFDEDYAENSSNAEPMPLAEMLDGWGFSSAKDAVLAAAAKLGLDKALGVCCLNHHTYDAEPGPMSYGPKLIFLGNFNV